MASITRMVVHDPLHQLDPLPHSLTCYPLGFPLTVRTNSPAVIEAACRCWRGYEPTFDTSPAELRVFVSDSSGSVPKHPPVFRGQGELMSVVADANNFAVCDLERSFTWCFVERRTVDNGPSFRMQFLESTVLCTLSSRHLAPIHAACVMMHRRGILLHAPSGAGKSCLAYACARRGWTFVSDDASYVKREGSARSLLGRPQALKIMETAVPLFPELAELPTIIDHRGERAVLIDAIEHPHIHTAFTAPAHALVFLRRERGPASVTDVEPGDAYERVVSELPVLSPRSYEEQKETVRRLLAVPVVELRYWTLEEGVAALEDLVGGAE